VYTYILGCINWIAQTRYTELSH